jgi:hypothetical protein
VIGRIQDGMLVFDLRMLEDTRELTEQLPQLKLPDLTMRAATADAESLAS